MIAIPTSGAGESGDSGGMKYVEGKPFKMAGPATLEPPYISTLEKTLSGKTEELTDQCGYTETRKNGDSNWELTVEGIIADRSLQAFDTISRSTDPINVACKIYSGQVLVQDPTITLEDELNAISFPGKGYDGTEDAMKFQLQLKEPSSNEGGGVLPNFS